MREAKRLGRIASESTAERSRTHRRRAVEVMFRANLVSAGNSLFARAGITLRPAVWIVAVLVLTAAVLVLFQAFAWDGLTILIVEASLLSAMFYLLPRFVADYRAEQSSRALLPCLDCLIVAAEQRVAIEEALAQAADTVSGVLGKELLVMLQIPERSSWPSYLVSRLPGPNIAFFAGELELCSSPGHFKAENLRRYQRQLQRQQRAELTLRAQLNEVKFFWLLLVLLLLSALFFLPNSQLSELAPLFSVIALHWPAAISLSLVAMLSFDWFCNR